jgi:hypothetical protein
MDWSFMFTRKAVGYKESFLKGFIGTFLALSAAITGVALAADYSMKGWVAGMLFTISTSLCAGWGCVSENRPTKGDITL